MKVEYLAELQEQDHTLNTRLPTVCLQMLVCSAHSFVLACRAFLLFVHRTANIVDQPGLMMDLSNISPFDRQLAFLQSENRGTNSCYVQVSPRLGRNSLA